MATGNTGGGTPPPPPQNNQQNQNSTTTSLITWIIRGSLIFVLLLLLFRTGCHKSKEEETTESTKTVEMLNPMGEFICHPGTELSLPPIKFTGGVKVRVNGHDHFVYYPSINEWQFRSKKIEQYNSPEVHYEDVLKVKADSTEKEPFIIYLYQVTEVEVPK